MRQSLIRAISGMVRRRWWIILQSMLVCGAILVVLAARNDAPDFTATSVVQVRPVADGGTSVFETDVDALMAAERQVVLSSAVLEPASRSIGVMTSDLLRGATDVAVDGASGTMRITVSDQDADVAMVAANSVADNYVSQRVLKLSRPLRDEADAIGAQLSELESRMATLAGQGESSATALAAAKTQYEGLFSRQQDLLSRASLQPKGAEVLTEASSATRDGNPSLLSAGALGVLIGLGIGVLIALVREFFDDKVQHRQEVERAAKLPVIAELPLDPESVSSRRRSRVSLATIDRPASPLAEAVRSLRTAVTFLSVESPIRCLTVTSGEPDEGKSLVAANLAVAFAQAGVKTILLSGDLRRPSLDARMLPQSARGLTDLIVLGRGDTLRGGSLANDLAAGVPDLVIEAHEVIYRTTIPNLSFVPAGTLPPNPAELLASKGAAIAISDLRQHCEMLIIDSPPTVVTDGVILADLADAVLLIAAVNQSHAVRIAAAVNAVSGGHVRILGVVLNKLHERAVLYQPHGAASPASRRARPDSAPSSARPASSGPSRPGAAARPAAPRAVEPPVAPPAPEIAEPTVAEPPVDEPTSADLAVSDPAVEEPALFDELDVAHAVEDLERDRLAPIVDEELVADEPDIEVSSDDALTVEEVDVAVSVDTEPVDTEPVETELVETEFVDADAVPTDEEEPEAAPESVAEMEESSSADPEPDLEPAPTPDSDRDPEPTTASADEEIVESERGPEPARPPTTFPPPTTAPMTPPIALQQVRSSVPPPPMPRSGRVPPPPPSRTGQSVPPPPPPARPGDSAGNGTHQRSVSLHDGGVRVVADGIVDAVPLISPTRENNVQPLREPRVEEAVPRSRRQLDRDQRRIEKEERDRQLRLGAELAKARRTLPRGFEARGDVGAEELEKFHAILEAQPQRVDPSRPMTRGERKLAKRKAKELRLAAKLQEKDRRRKQKEQLEKSRAEAKRAIAEAKGHKAPG